MGLFQATSCMQPDWKQFLIHKATWLPATFEGNQIASKLPGVYGGFKVIPLIKAQLRGSISNSYNPILREI